MARELKAVNQVKISYSAPKGEKLKEQVFRLDQMILYSEVKTNDVFLKNSFN